MSHQIGVLALVSPLGCCFYAMLLMRPRRTNRLCVNAYTCMISHGAHIPKQAPWAFVTEAMLVMCAYMYLIDAYLCLCLHIVTLAWALNGRCSRAHGTWIAACARALRMQPADTHKRVHTHTHRHMQPADTHTLMHVWLPCKMLWLPHTHTHTHAYICHMQCVCALHLPFSTTLCPMVLSQP